MVQFTIIKFVFYLNLMQNLNKKNKHYQIIVSATVGFNSLIKTLYQISTLKLNVLFAEMGKSSGQTRKRLQKSK